MRNFLILTCFVTLLFSCKKSHNCHCSTNVIFTSNQSLYNSKTTEISQKLTRKQAQAVCDDEAKNINTTYTNVLTDNGSVSTVATSQTNCSLE